MSVSLIGGTMAVGMKKQGAIAEYPATLSPQNAAFLEQNFDRLQALLAPYVEEGGEDDERSDPQK
jgi:hypothetical protein